MAPSWLRIGSFQIHSSRAEYESVRQLGEYASRELLAFSDAGPKVDTLPVLPHGSSIEEIDKAPRKPWARRLVEEVAVRNAKTIALWQVYGFMHGGESVKLLGSIMR